MNSSTKNFVNDLANSICCCPFCAASAHVDWAGLDPTMYGVRCRNCGASIPAIHPNSEDAIRTWNRRSGLATIGGRATRGCRSQRKLVAAKRNLKKARQVRQLNRLRQGVEADYVALRQYREQERAIRQAAIAEKRAWLKEREHLILADPILCKLYKRLTKRSDST